LFGYGEHCALLDELWSAPIDALDQAPIPAGLPRPQTVQCAGADQQPPAPESVSTPRDTSPNGGASGGDPPLATLSKEADSTPSNERPRRLVQADIEPRAR